MDPDPEVKRQKSIAFILRRRTRARKLGANAGGVIKSTQKRMRGHLVFEPSGSYMGPWRFLVFLGFLGAIAIPFAFLSVLNIDPGHSHETLAHTGNDFVGWGLLGLCAILLIAICAFAIAYLALFFWRVLQTPHPSQK